MNVSGAPALNALIQVGLQAASKPTGKQAPAPTPPPAAAGGDSDGDSDGSGRVGSNLNVKA